MSYLVEMTSIDKRFPGVHALKGVDFNVKAGEVHALMGENGAGKSTLMKVLSGLYSRDGGDMKIEGQSVNLTGPAEAQAMGIGIVHQELSLMNDLNIAQNVFIGREPRRSFGRLNDAEQNHQTAEIFKSMNLNLDPKTLVGTLTIAKQQMVEIAKALSYKSKVLVMDEPTAALNEAEIEELFLIISRLKSEGVGIVYISHKMDEIKRIADRVTIMRDGEYIDTVKADETPLSQIISMMVGREITQQTANIPDTSKNEIVLEVSKLNRSKEIIDVSFEVRKGEILGFAGLMGAGRTEVARAIFGADPLDSGEIKVHGKTVSIKSPHDAVIAGVGYLSEDRKKFGLATGMDVRANIVMASLSKYTNMLGVLAENELEGIASKYISLLGIRTPNDQQEVRNLSGGNQQKVVIAKWLLRECDILIFDEPTRGIDVGAKSEIYKLLEELAEQGKAIIVISSEMPEIIRISHRIAVMCEGRLTGMLQGGSEVDQEEIMRLATQRDAVMRVSGAN
jgi:ribose transport system ATP-binding protein